MAPYTSVYMTGADSDTHRRLRCALRELWGPIAGISRILRFLPCHVSGSVLASSQAGARHMKTGHVVSLEQLWVGGVSS